MACQEQKISQSDARSRDERKAKEFCRNKERCSFTPGYIFLYQLLSIQLQNVIPTIQDGHFSN